VKAEFRATTPADAAAIAEFMARIFQLKPGQPVIDPAVMQWKYWQERAGWTGSRSYVLERGSSIIAHGAAWPCKLESGEGIRCLHLIDWAASPEFPGSGMSIVKHMNRIAPVVIVCGGTEVARKAHVAMGFRPRNEVRSMALPLRPFHQILTSRRNWKMPARLMRNLVWSLRRRGASPRWTAREESRLDPRRCEVPSKSKLISFERSSEMFTYLSECPAARIRSYLSLRDSQPAGYFCLSFVAGQARIADAWINSERSEDLRENFALAVRQAVSEPEVNEITALAPDPISADALVACGFRERSRDPVFLLDPHARVPPGAGIAFQMIDGDAAFLSTGTPDYLT